MFASPCIGHYVRSLQDRSRMLVSDGTSATISVANREPKEPLAEPRPHWNHISIASRSLSNQICDRFDIPISIGHESMGETFIKDAPPLSRVEIVRLASLDPCLCPVSWRRHPIRLSEEYRRRNHDAADLEVPGSNRPSVIAA